MASGGSKGFVDVVTSLRGLACLGVCLAHMSGGIAETLLGKMLHHGQLRVPMFFSMSGFVMALILDRPSLSIAGYPRYLLRRVVRLAPPLFATLALIVLITMLSQVIQGGGAWPTPIPTRQILANLSFVPWIFGEEWMAYSYWTLGVEAVFYLVAPFMVLLAFRTDQRARTGVVLCFLGATSVLLSEKVLMALAFPAILTGLATYALYSKKLSPSWGLIIFLILLGAVWFTTSSQWAIACLLTGALILVFPKLKVRGLHELGIISYSLYLVHEPIHSRVLNLGARFVPIETLNWASIPVSLGISLVTAICLWKLVEQPAQRLSRRLKKRPAS